MVRVFDDAWRNARRTCRRRVGSFSSGKARSIATISARSRRRVASAPIRAHSRSRSPSSRRTRHSHSPPRIALLYQTASPVQCHEIRALQRALALFAFTGAVVAAGRTSAVVRELGPDMRLQPFWSVWLVVAVFASHPPLDALVGSLISGEGTATSRFQGGIRQWRTPTRPPQA
jgi:hypothetical protein